MNSNFPATSAAGGSSPHGFDRSTGSNQRNTGSDSDGLEAEYKGRVSKFLNSFAFSHAWREGSREWKCVFLTPTRTKGQILFPRLGFLLVRGTQLPSPWPYFLLSESWWGAEGESWKAGWLEPYCHLSEHLWSRADSWNPSPTPHLLPKALQGCNLLTAMRGSGEKWYLHFKPFPLLFIGGDWLHFNGKEKCGLSTILRVCFDRPW